MRSNRSEHVLSQAAWLRCPLCGAEVFTRGASLVCHTGHCFDVSAKGYVNFVPAQRDVFYDEALFESRARIHGMGAYAAVADALGEAVPEDADVLDAGCGDGYYARCLSGARRVFALDLSRHAVALAARGGTDVCLMVGDLTRLPFRDGVLDAVVNVLSPAHYPEFRRVLRPGGRVVKVVPQEDYLIELRQAAGALLRHTEYSNRQTVELFYRQFPGACEREVRTVFPVSGAAQRSDVLHMTPLLAGVDKNDAAFRGIDRVTVSVKLLIGKVD